MKTKAEYQELLLQMVEPLKGHYSEGGSSLQLGAIAAGYGNRVAGMEGFSRVLWGLVSYWAGGGTDESFLPLYQRGLCEGTNPDSPEYWGDLHDKDQRMVEMAAISYGILMAPEKLWDPLGETGKEQLAAWLYQINLYTQADNNWHYFKVITNLALKSTGRKRSREQVKEAMERYESFYLGNGWYSDGNRPQKDYYTSFGIHFYCLLYAKFMEKEDQETVNCFKRRAVQFAKTFIYWFDDEGKALPFGRSLTYRFAQAAFFSACALAGVECVPWGVMKGIIGRHMDYWMRQPVYYDTTAGVCAACGLLELSEHVPPLEKNLYVQSAVRCLKAVTERFCEWNPERDSIVTCGSARYDRAWDRQVPIIYGDYFLVEGVLRLLERDFLIW